MGSKSKKNNQESEVPNFKSTKVLLTPEGNLILALPIYINEIEDFISESDSIRMTFTSDLGLFVHAGFILYHPDVGEFVAKKTITKMFEDLGEL
jgi:hypothetical protein